MAREHSRRTHTGEYLSEAFWEIYRDKPIGQITVKELTERAGVHRSSFYGHFDDIYDFLRREEETLLEGIEAYIDFRNAVDTTPFENILRYYQQNLPRLSLLCGGGGDGEFSVRLRERIIPEVMDFLNIPKEDKEAYYILDFIVNGMLSFLTTWYRREGEMPSAATLSCIRNALMNGGRDALMQRSSDPQTVERFMRMNGLAP